LLSDIIRILPDSVIWVCDAYYTIYTDSYISLFAGPIFTYVETIAGPQEEAGGYCGHGAEQPEQEKARAVCADPADIVFNKDHAGIKRGEEKNRRDTGRDKRRPQYRDDALYKG
jgi:hypothetical protein